MSVQARNWPCMSEQYNLSSLVHNREWPSGLLQTHKKRYRTCVHKKEFRRDKLGQEVGQPSRLSLKDWEKMKRKKERTERVRKRWEILTALGFSSKASLSRTPRTEMEEPETTGKSILTAIFMVFVGVRSPHGTQNEHIQIFEGFD